MRELGIEKVTKLASNENPIGPSPRVVEALGAAASEVHIYPDPECVELSAALGTHLGVDPAQVVIGRGSDEIIHLLGLAFLGEGDNIVFASPYFTLYRTPRN